MLWDKLGGRTWRSASAHDRPAQSVRAAARADVGSWYGLAARRVS
jgi:hypothetical protein